MSNLNEKILHAENRAIDVLTKFTWWSEVRFEKNNVYWVAIFFTFSTLFLAPVFALGMHSLGEEKKLALVLCALAFALAVLVFLFQVSFLQSYLKIVERWYPQGNPNPCRILKKQSFKRRKYVSFLFFGLFLISVYGNVMILFFTLSLSCDTLAIFLAACDSIPPQEKNRRKAVYEARNSKMVMNL